MSSAVVGVNLILAGICLWAAWRLWQLRCQLVQFTDQLDAVYGSLRALGSEHWPELIGQGRQTAATLRLQRRALERQRRLLGQILTLIGWLRLRPWRRWGSNQ